MRCDKCGVGQLFRASATERLGKREPPDRHLDRGFPCRGCADEHDRGRCDCFLRSRVQSWVIGSRHGHAILGDDDLFAGCRSVHELRQICLGFVQVGDHGHVSS
jgi:hypothetical protein